MANWQLFVRHAHRDTFGHQDDNGLSERGHAQGRALATYLAEFHPDRKPRKVLSSSKIRCLETAEYIARWAKVPVVEDPRLIEQQSDESSKDFFERLAQFALECRLEHECCFVSHGDVLPVVLSHFNYRALEIKKGDLFWVVNGQVEEVNAIQKSGV